MKKLRYFWQNKFYYIDLIHDNTGQRFTEYEKRNKTTHFEWCIGKDEFGNEIFEGDILGNSNDIDADDQSLWVVQYIDFAFWFVNPYDKTNLNDYEFLKNNKYKNYWKTMRVIGNIHQNADLLE